MSCVEMWELGSPTLLAEEVKALELLIESSKVYIYRKSARLVVARDIGLSSSIATVIYLAHYWIN